jgi:hypothetical protein
MRMRKLTLMVALASGLAYAQTDQRNLNIVAPPSTATGAASLSGLTAERLSGTWVSRTDGAKYQIHGQAQQFTITGTRRFQASITDQAISGVYLFQGAKCGQTTTQYRVVCHDIADRYPLTAELSKDANSLQLKFEEPQLQIDTKGGMLDGMVQMTVRERRRLQITETLVRESR